MYAAGHGVKPWRAARAGGVPFGWRAGLAVVIVALTGVGMAVAAQGGTSVRYTTVVVQPGDTLWSIAGARYPGDDVRERVQDIEQANELSGPEIRAGETLRLPG
ncbi:MAG TPA: LysM peptidoglycan-binding domain-containing protein, partial [Candidatus Dormibacteraeota bacterium]|nr:LysM peptidoglycan-binding domain-containing protein [Candidatus Dormibacteraeota bacterium]